MEDISWPSSPIGTVSCTAFVLSHWTERKRRRGGREEEEEEGEEEGRDGTEENHTTSTLTVGNNSEDGFPDVWFLDAGFA